MLSYIKDDKVAFAWPEAGRRTLTRPHSARASARQGASKSPFFLNQDKKLLHDIGKHHD